jgi:hypothetical protein
VAIHGFGRVAQSATQLRCASRQNSPPASLWVKPQFDSRSRHFRSGLSNGLASARPACPKRAIRRHRERINPRAGSRARST